MPNSKRFVFGIILKATEGSIGLSLSQLRSYLLTYSMEQSSTCKATRFSPSQAIPSILWHAKVHYRVNNSPTCPYPEPAHTVHAPPSHFLKIHLSVILPSTPRSSKWSFSLRFLHQNPVYTHPLPHTCYMPRPLHSSRFYQQNNIW